MLIGFHSLVFFFLKQGAIKSLLWDRGKRKVKGRGGSEDRRRKENTLILI